MKKIRPCPEVIAREVQPLCRLNMKVCIEAETNEICQEHVLADVEITKEEGINGQTDEASIRGTV